MKKSNKKKTYNDLKIEIVEFNEDQVIVTSGEPNYFDEEYLNGRGYRF